MKKKEIKKLAEEIASYERIIQTTQDTNEKSEAQNKVIRLSEKAETIDDMWLWIYVFKKSFLTNLA